MYDPKLTVDELQERIGAELKHASIEIAPESPLMGCLKQSREIDRKIGPFGKSAERARLIDREADEFHRLEIYFFLEGARDKGFLVDYDPVRGLAGLSFYEMLYNAMEHGSEFGQSGGVNVELFHGDLGIGVIFRDPGPGYSPNTIAMRRHPDGRGRGVRHVYSSTPDVAYGTDRSTDGFATLLFYPKANGVSNIPIGIK